MAAQLSAAPDPRTTLHPGSYIRATWHLPWAWGRVDCTLWVADWCVARSGVDPAAAWRGRYASEAQMRALTGDSLSAFLGRVCPLPVIDAAREGDAAVIRVAGLEVAAIALGCGQYAFRHPRGVGVKRARPVLIWRV